MNTFPDFYSEWNPPRRREVPTPAEDHWQRTWDKQRGYLANAVDDETAEHYSRLCKWAYAQLIMAQVTK